MPNYLVACLRLARNSKSERMRFGTIIVKDGRIIGKGWNRRLNRDEKPPFPVCPWSIHAEQDAIFQALLAGESLEGSLMYVAGYFADTGKIYVAVEPVSTCLRCHKLRQQYGIKAKLRTAKGWRSSKRFFKPENAVEFRKSNCVS